MRVGALLICSLCWVADLLGQTPVWTPLHINTEANEVLIGFDGEQLFFRRYEGRGGAASVLASSHLAPGFAMSRASGFMGFGPEEPMVLRAVRPENAAGLGDIGHVSIDAERGVMVMSAKSKRGDWDLFVADRTAEGDWSLPRHMTALNTASDEVFPNLLNGDIWFASNCPGSLGGFDIYVARRANQWRTAEAAPAVMRTTGDELAAVPAGAVEADGFYICAAHIDGAGGSDIYFVGAPAVEEMPSDTLFSCQIQHNLRPLPGLEVAVRRRGDGGPHVFRGVTDAEGWVMLGGLNLEATHVVTVRPSRSGERLPDLSFLHVFAEAPGMPRTRVRTYRIEGGEVFAFDMLPFDAFEDLDAVTTPDTSALPSTGPMWVVHFGPGESVLTAQDRAAGERWLQSLGGTFPTGWVCELTGHADASGDAGAHEELGRRRAEAVADWLHGQGVPSSVLRVETVGERGATGNGAHDRRCEVRMGRVGG